MAWKKSKIISHSETDRNFSELFSSPVKSYRIHLEILQIEKWLVCIKIPWFVFHTG